ncbi:hypothetical protein [Lysobacter gummosus]
MTSPAPDRVGPIWPRRWDSPRSTRTARARVGRSWVTSVIGVADGIGEIG